MKLLATYWKKFDTTFFKHSVDLI